MMAQDKDAIRHNVVAMLGTLLEQNGVERSTQEIETELDTVIGRLATPTEKVVEELAQVGIGRCETCGKPATITSRDPGVFVVPPERMKNPNSGYREFEPGATHYWCNVHAPD